MAAEIIKHTRELTVSGLKLREAGEGEKSRAIEGYACKWNERSKLIYDWPYDYYEVLERGCMTPEMLATQDVFFTLYHDASKIVGRSVNGVGTLTMTIDEIGLKVECEMPHTVWGDEALELVSRGDLTGMSFIYSTKEDDADAVSYELLKSEEGNDIYLRHVKRIDKVYDVTIARYPAYKQTEISTKEREAIENLQKSAGCTDTSNTPEQMEREAKFADEVNTLKREAARLRREINRIY